jgi:AGZA family xanthine/uracil permease-like MFS transporter
VTLAIVPSLAYLVLIYFDQVAGALGGISAAVARQAPGAEALVVMPAQLAETHQVIRVIGNGFIVTAMIWGAAAAHLIDRQTHRASLYLGVGALLSLFGVIHSVKPMGEIYLPWNAGSQMVWAVAAAYALTAAVLIGLGAVSTPEDSC